ncbi:MAG: TonB-dependent receptor, partial [Gemmatimonadota bacterium]
ITHRLLCGILAAALAGNASEARAQATRADSLRPADSTVLTLAPLEVRASIRPFVSGPGVRSGVPARLVTFGVRELRAWRPRLVSDALHDRGSASLYDDLGSPLKQSLVMRGFSASPVVGLPQGVTVLVDGIAMNEPGAGEVNFELLPFEFAEHIEVLSGTASILGPNSLGGAINLITRTGTGTGSGSATASIEMRAGSFGERGGSISTAGEAGGYEYFAGGGYERANGWRAAMRDTRAHFLVSAGRSGAQHGVRVFAFGGRSDAQTAGSLPMSVYRIQPDSNLTAGDFELLRQLSVGASGYAPLFGGSASARLYVRAGDAERFNANQEADPDVRSFAGSRSAGAAADWSVTRAIAPGSISLRVGTGGLLNRSSIALYAERIDAGLTTDVHSPIRRLNAYGLASLDLGAFTASAGLRYDAVRVPFRNRLNPARDTTSTFDQLSPRIGLSVRVTSASSAYASFGRSFRPPALIEIACADPNEPCPLPFALGDDPPIDPVRVATYEIGYNWQRDGLVAQLSAYRSNVRADIFLFPYEGEDEPAGSTIDGYFDNVPRTRRVGLEAYGSWTSAARHRAFLSYAWTRATFESAGLEIFSVREITGAENEVEKGSRFPLVPDHTFAAGAAVVIRNGIETGVRITVVGERYLRGDEANHEPPLPAYATADLRLGLLYRGWTLDAVLRNVTNARYLAFGTFNINQGPGVLERFVTPGRPRGFEAAIHRSF